MTVSAGQQPLDRVGTRLAQDSELPTWLHPLVDWVGRQGMPDELRRRTAAVAPADARHSAVLMLMGEGPAGPDLLLIARATTLRTHAGQPAFPGGRSDPGESAVQAALREGQEETGLEPTSVTPAALLPEIFLPVGSYVVRPVLGYWHSPGPVHAVDPGETASVARVPIAELADPANRVQVRHHSGYVGPAFTVADMLVWGFTAGLVDALLEGGGWTQPWDTERYVTLPPALVPRMEP